MNQNNIKSREYEIKNINGVVVFTYNTPELDRIGDEEQANIEEVLLDNCAEILYFGINYFGDEISYAYGIVYGEYKNGYAHLVLFDGKPEHYIFPYDMISSISNETGELLYQHPIKHR